MSKIQKVPLPVGFSLVRRQAVTKKDKLLVYSKSAISAKEKSKRMGAMGEGDNFRQRGKARR